jgi:hypothetical protein
MEPDERPICGQQYQDCQMSFGQILLITKILIRSNNGIKPGGLHRVKQVAILQGAPPAFMGGGNLVARQKIS